MIETFGQSEDGSSVESVAVIEAEAVLIAGDEELANGARDSDNAVDNVISGTARRILRNPEAIDTTSGLWVGIEVALIDAVGLNVGVLGQVVDSLSKS